MHPHLLAGARSPSLHGQRRFQARSSHLSQDFRRRHRRTRGRRSVDHRVRNCLTRKVTPRNHLSTLLRELAVAAGSQKLIAGQVADLEAEGKNVNRRELQFIHENKTAAILRSSVRLGAMSANAEARRLSAITRFGQRLGLAFQIIDDILDVTQTSEVLGKSAGKDAAAHKATYPAVVGWKNPVPKRSD